MAGIDLRKYDEEAAPAKGGATGLRASDLSDGKYEIAIDKAVIKEVKGNNILELTMTVLSPGKHEGAQFTNGWFMNDQEGFNRVLGNIFETLGFDTPNWKKANGRPASAEMVKALRWLSGLRFAGRKVTSEKKGKDGKPMPNEFWHNIYIDKRLDTDGKPRYIGPVELNEPDADDPFGDA